ncbi:MAG: PQQ-dependent sugar dehydrogenase [Actinomycetota bacterium]
MARLRLPATIVLVFPLMAPVARAAAPEPRPFLEGLTFPTNMAFAPDGTLFYTEKETGNVRVVTPAGTLLDRPFITLAVMPEAERGLLGIALHPDFDEQPWVYLYFSDPVDARNRLVRVRADGAVAVGEPETLLEGLSAVAGYHNGGDLVFDSDGALFVALGEAHEAERAQDPGDLGGKIVRLTESGDVPTDGSFGSDTPVWSIGHRNSFGLCVDPASGELWETENGPDRDDEVNLIERGGNYGWPLVTGRADDERFVDPVVVFGQPIAITGCAVVDGDLWFGSFDGRLWRLARDARGSGEVEEIATFPTGVTDVSTGPRGELYVATADAIWTVRPPTGSPAPSPNIPRPTAGAESPIAPVGSAGSDDGSGVRTWIAIGALIVLAGALGARFVAGRRLRSGRRSRDDRPGSAG